MRSTQGPGLSVREAVFPADQGHVRRLWLEYLTWGNDEMQRLHGVHPHSPAQTVDEDLAQIHKFQAPAGRMVLACLEGSPRGIGCLRGANHAIAEVKRMYVEPAARGLGAGAAILGALIDLARQAGCDRVRLDSPRFMTAAHVLYRKHAFVDIPPYAESEIPAGFHPYMLFMERRL
jgi:GNAT superfamily N-acetyltransferase